MLDARVPLKMCPFNSVLEIIWPSELEGVSYFWSGSGLKFYRSKNAEQKNLGFNGSRSSKKMLIEKCNKSSKQRILVNL